MLSDLNADPKLSKPSYKLPKNNDPLFTFNHIFPNIYPPDPEPNSTPEPPNS